MHVSIIIVPFVIQILLVQFLLLEQNLTRISCFFSKDASLEEIILFITVV